MSAIPGVFVRAPAGLPRGPVAFPPGEPPSSERTDLRQLRHLTANALQRILQEVMQEDGLRRTAAGRRLCDDLERRIRYSAALSDALFGFTRQPAPLAERLRSLGDAVLGLLGDPDQLLNLDISVQGDCPAELESTVLRVAHELIGNAVKHGFYARLIGRIQVVLSCGADGATLVVADNGWGCGHRPGHGQGMGLVRALIAPFDGTFTLQSGEGVTATVVLRSGRRPEASGPARS